MVSRFSLKLRYCLFLPRGRGSSKLKRRGVFFNWGLDKVSILRAALSFEKNILWTSFFFYFIFCLHFTRLFLFLGRKIVHLPQFFFVYCFYFHIILGFNIGFSETQYTVAIAIAKQKNEKLSSTKLCLSVSQRVVNGCLFWANFSYSELPFLTELFFLFV